MFQKEKDYPGNYEGKFTFKNGGAGNSIESNASIGKQNKTPADILYGEVSKKEKQEKNIKICYLKF